MTNSWDSNPYILDTAEDKTIVALIDYMLWEPAAADDDLVVKDSHGNILWQIRASAGCPGHEDFAQQKSEHMCRWVNGINIETIDGGMLYIYTL